MARDENPPFMPGETYFGAGATISTQDVTDTQYLEGKEWLSEDIDYSPQGSKPRRSGRMVLRRLVRNNSGGALLPKRLVTPEASAGVYDGRVDGYADVTSERSWAVDEYLPAAGVANKDLFWVVVKGPAIIKTTLAGDATNVINVGSKVNAATAVTSGATTAGRIQLQPTLSAATSGVVDFTTIFNDALNVIGRALSAKTTANTDADLLVDIQDRW